MKEGSYEELSREVAGALVAAEQRVVEWQPWRAFSDVDLIGVRDPHNGELGLATILGSQPPSR